MFELNIADTAALFADPARAAMLTALLDRSPLCAGELAFAANVSPQTASFHLSKLTSSGMLKSERKGRHHIYQLAGAGVASAIESLAAISPVSSHRGRFSGEKRNARMEELSAARTCYDHLAGQLAVTLHDSLFTCGYLVKSKSREYALTSKGRSWLDHLGARFEIPPSQSPLVRPCLDWTERTPHLAGRLAARLLDLFFCLLSRICG